MHIHFCVFLRGTFLTVHSFQWAAKCLGTRKNVRQAKGKATFKITPHQTTWYSNTIRFGCRKYMCVCWMCGGAITIMAPVCICRQQRVPVHHGKCASKHTFPSPQVGWTCPDISKQWLSLVNASIVAKVVSLYSIRLTQKKKNYCQFPSLSFLHSRYVQNQ